MLVVLVEAGGGISLRYMVVSEATVLVGVLGLVGPRQFAGVLMAGRAGIRLDRVLRIAVLRTGAVHGVAYV